MDNNFWIEINRRRGRKERGTSSITDFDMFRVLSDIRQNFPSSVNNFATLSDVKNETYIVSWNDSEEKSECCICKEEITSEDNRKKLSCGHKFHGRCLGEWILEKRECPMCRRNLILTQGM